MQERTAEQPVWFSTEWFAAHPWITYFIIFFLIAYVFNKVFRTGKLPLLKNIIVYLAMAAGSFVLLILQIDGLAIIYCLGVAFLLMLIVRIRYFVQSLQGGKTNNSDRKSRESR